MDLVRQQQVVEDEVEDDDEESSYSPPKKVLRKSSLVGGGSVMTVDGNEEFLSERNLRRALPEISQTLRNWTMHGQNLGHMVYEYKRKSNHAHKGSITDWKLFQYGVKRIGHDRKYD